jgi:hypothetical protein
MWENAEEKVTNPVVAREGRPVGILSPASPPGAAADSGRRGTRPAPPIRAS